ncbi:NUDIX domain-containing protein [Candidatus Thorarchaeota archaeon]|nr:MAG: NUDIX domain-containing protein [Candidatus Thorarchaeota archaeon]
MTPIAITILQHPEGFLFIKRRKAPYEGLWALVGGKIAMGEHIPSAAEREVMEETSSQSLTDYRLHAIVSERLIDTYGLLSGHFLMFLGSAKILDFKDSNREGDLAVFTMDAVRENSAAFLPSDLEMFQRFVSHEDKAIEYHEAELVYTGGGYDLNYYRDDIL